MPKQPPKPAPFSTKAVARLQADCAYQARMLKALRDKLVLIDSEKEDEGGRVYFASTNDADEFHAVVESLDDWEWERVIPSLELPDLYADLSMLRETLRQIDGEAPANEPHDGPTVGFPPSRDPEIDDGNDTVREAFDEGVTRGLWLAAQYARLALASRLAKLEAE